jgi:hypothetical protein
MLPRLDRPAKGQLCTRPDLCVVPSSERSGLRHLVYRVSTGVSCRKVFHATSETPVTIDLRGMDLLPNAMVIPRGRGADHQ